MRFVRLAAASAAITIAVSGLAASASFAGGNPHFMHGSPQYSIADNAVTASGYIAGVGKQDAVINLTADATVSCVNHGGNTPPGLQKSVSSPSLTATPDKNGKLFFSVTTASLDGACPGNMMAQVKFTSATLIAQVGSVTLKDVHPF
jgi:hypothetical protein